ncbi:hypothetical protein JMUB7526_28730 [Staphylococcus aureus]
MIRRPPRSTRKESSAASDVYKRQGQERLKEINNICHMDGVELLKMPNIEDVMSGELEVNQLKKLK